MILASVGLVVVVIVAVAIFFQASGDDRFGTVLDLEISPSSSTIMMGQSTTLTSVTILSTCNWSSSNTPNASITSSTTKSAIVEGHAVGVVTITETCGALGRYPGTANVAVNPPPTAKPIPRRPNDFWGPSLEIYLTGFGSTRISLVGLHGNGPNQN